MDIVVFGTGEIGKAALPLLEKEYHILFFVDNNKKKWGTMFEGYRVECPDELKKYDCNVVVSSTKYRREIAGQLRQMGIGKDQIFFCRRFPVGDTLEVELCPWVERKLKAATKPLVQYDIYHVEEEITNCRKVLIFCRGYSVYAKQLIENMSKRYDDIEFSLLTRAHEYKGRIISDRLKHIYCFQSMADLKAILEQIPIYDAMQLLWIEQEWSYFYRLVREKTKHLNLNVGGSDFYRTDKETKDYKRALIACADKVTAETKGTVEEFQGYYSQEVKGKMGLLPFGIEVLDWINTAQTLNRDKLKEKFCIPLDKIVVTCGHNANEEHQHIRIISALEQLTEKIKDQIVCVFPMTYPRKQESYIEEIRNRLEATGLEYVILTEFMDFQSMAEYALISDIMVHVQTTDQLSSTMLEEMYAGSIVIAGSWLPYKSLHEMNIYFLDVDAIPDATAVMEEVIANLDNYQEKCKGNKEIVWNHSSWDALAPQWRELWD